ncbi:MAG: ADP-heptose synthase, bifunctional sugar kinase/adenylyltransferase [Bacteroidetes bacterium 38_7]|nr:MAG: ADP-heptose synthase, bifunctional sugar kinase/adenylyltransferase [Bacteroidetes bacterium 38_7]HAL64721.1 D-glycero-beta-D-manno-heptose-7-phosphate kinase [Bacteroidales bacterium]
MSDTRLENDLFKKFQNLCIMVIGDAMIDSYIWGKVNRLSPEAPVPIVDVVERSNRLGGAANVALNIKSLGARPILCSVIGEDATSKTLIQLMRDYELDEDGILQSNDRITTTKFRIFGNNTQLLRVDEETTHPILPNDQSRLLQTIKFQIHTKHPDIIIFQDYDKGVITQYIIQNIIQLATEAGIKVCVDPKHLNFWAYNNVFLFKPNLKELKNGLKSNYNYLLDKFNLEEAIMILQENINADIVLVTLSDKGMVIRYSTESDEFHYQVIPAHLRNIADVSGAGDTVISVASLCLAAGLSPLDAAKIANVAGGLVCEELGVVPVNAKHLSEEINRLEIL